MCDGVVIRLPSGEEICVRIPVEEGPKWPPDDDPWKDLFVIRTIYEHVSQLGAEDIRVQLTESLRSSAQSVVRQLPGSFELGDAFLANTRRASAGD